MSATRGRVLGQWRSAYPAVIREHRVLLSLVGGYIVGVALFHAAVGQWHDWSILLLPARILHVAVATSALLLGLEALFRRGQVDLGARRVLSAVLVLMLAAPLQSSFHAFKQ